MVTSVLLMADRRDNADIVALLLQYGALSCAIESDTRSFTMQELPLLFRIVHYLNNNSLGKYPRATLGGFQRILSRHKNKINAKDESYGSLLFFVLNFDFEEQKLKKAVIKRLLEAGANVCQIDRKKIMDDFPCCFAKDRLEKSLHKAIVPLSAGDSTKGMWHSF
jgi:hypothetical protein